MDWIQGTQTIPEMLDLNAIKAQIAALEAPPRVDVARQLRTTRADRMPLWALLRDMVRITRGPGRLTPQEYFYYRLHDPALSRHEARSHVGKRAQTRLHHACNDVRWFAVTHDKALFYATASGAGLPVPRTQAIRAGRAGVRLRGDPHPGEVGGVPP